MQGCIKLAWERRRLAGESAWEGRRLARVRETGLAGETPALPGEA